MSAKPKQSAPSTSAPATPLPQGPLAIMREWFDALVIAFVLAMFVRTFMVELFKIPTGSMTPTLIGGEVVELDYNRDKMEDLLLVQRGAPPLLFLNDGKRLVGQGPVRINPNELRYYKHHAQYDRILVNKMAYWFRPPNRGEVIVFKTPPNIFEADKPIYIKRCVGEPGDTLTFDAQGHLVANGQRVTEPGFFQTQCYVTRVGNNRDFFKQPEISYDFENGANVLQRINVPRDKVYAFGDNTHSSLDSRYWGGVPLANLKGRAFMRYWPARQMKFL